MVTNAKVFWMVLRNNEEIVFVTMYVHNVNNVNIIIEDVKIL